MKRYIIACVFFVSFNVHQKSFAQWTDISNPQLGSIYKIKFISPTNGWLLNQNGGPSLSGLLKTTDGGNTWVRIRDHSSGLLLFFDFYDDSLGYVAGINGFDWTRNGGTTWIELGGVGGPVNKIFSPNLAFVGAHDLYLSKDSLRNWSHVSRVPAIGLYPVFYKFAFLSPDTIIACGGSDVLLVGDWTGTIECNRSVDSGKTWQLTYFDTTWFCNAVVFANRTGYSLYLLTSGPSIDPHIVTLKTTNSGATWFAIPALISSGNFRVVDAYFMNYKTGFICGAAQFGNDSGLARTTDGGIVWNYVPGVTRATGTLRTMSWLDSLHGWVAGDSGRIYKTTTGGWLPIQLASFTGIHLGGTRVRLDWRTLSETNNLGFYVQRRRQSDTAFTQISQLIPGYGTTNEPHDYSFTDSNATINRWYYRLKQVDLSGPIHYTEPIIVDVLTGVEEKQAPLAFSLEQNYPNPFNPTTMIHYELPNGGIVSLNVYDILGRAVATVESGFKLAGRYDSTFDASTLSSGVYIYKLTAGNFTASKKLLLVK